MWSTGVLLLTVLIASPAGAATPPCAYSFSAVFSDGNASFLAAIDELPRVTSLRLVYADWLEEAQDGRADYVRAVAAREALPEESAERAAADSEVVRQGAALIARTVPPALRGQVELEFSTVGIPAVIFLRLPPAGSFTAAAPEALRRFVAAMPPGARYEVEDMTNASYLMTLGRAEGFVHVARGSSLAAAFQHALLLDTAAPFSDLLKGLLGAIRLRERPDPIRGLLWPNRSTTSARLGVPQFDQLFGDGPHRDGPHTARQLGQILGRAAGLEPSRDWPELIGRSRGRWDDWSAQVMVEALRELRQAPDSVTSQRAARWLARMFGRNWR